MTDTMGRRLSELLSDAEDVPRSRRDFLARASALGTVIPLAGAVLTGCETTPRQKSVEQHDTGTTARQSPNADSKLDTAHGGARHSMTPTAAELAQAAPYHRYDPTLPPLSSRRTLTLEWTAQEVPLRIRDDTVVAAWTFNGDIPGPIVHCRVGDTVEFTLTNKGTLPHSMDFHAAQIDPTTAFRSTPPGQSVSYSFKPRHAGAFLYHCGTSPVLMHLGSGMFGAIIVSPATPLAPAKEFVLVHSEYYLGQPVSGVQPCDYNKMLATLPDYVVFNGRPSQYQSDPIRVHVGDRVRFHVVNAGPTHPCGFHVVGEQFDTVYLGAPPASAIHGVQTFGVCAGGGMIFELVADVPGTFPFVNHGFGHGQKGAIGALVVES